MKRFFIISPLLINLGLGLISQAQAQDITPTSDHTRYTLDKVVMLSRHGIRPQTSTASLNKATGKNWPAWLVPDGHLSGHGYAGMVAQGTYLKNQWQAAGLSLTAQSGCPPQHDVWLWAAPDQRTRATGAALLDGMYPGCGLPVHATWQKHDPLFDTLSMGLAKPDRQILEQQVMDKMVSPQHAATHYQHAVETLRHAVCAKGADNCRFLNAQWGVEVTDEGKAKLTGPVSKGATIGETIRMQYSENLPLSEVAFGHARNAEDISALMALHAAKYDLLSRSQEYARHGGSVLMRQILDALTASEQQPDTHHPELNSKLVILVGHDTNIAQIQTMLGFNWQLPVYPANDIPPGGSLILERYRDKQTGEELVRILFTARTLDQWRQLSPLNTQHPLPVAELSRPDCKTTSVGILCPMNTFVSHQRSELSDDGKNTPVFQ